MNFIKSIWEKFKAYKEWILSYHAKQIYGTGFIIHVTCNLF